MSLMIMIYSFDKEDASIYESLFKTFYQAFVFNIMLQMSQFKYFPVTFNKFIFSAVCNTTFQGMKNSHFHVQLHVFDPQFTFDFCTGKELAVFFSTFT